MLVRLSGTIILKLPSVSLSAFVCPILALMNTGAQSAGPPKRDQPHQNHSTTNSRSRSRNHARGSLGSLGLASLFACCFIPFSLRSFGILVATLFTSPGVLYHSAGPCCAHQLGRAAQNPATRRFQRLLAGAFLIAGSSPRPAAPRRCRSRRRTTRKIYSGTEHILPALS